MPRNTDGTYYNVSLRYQDWDYASDGAYFLTICTLRRQKFFGYVKNGEIILSDIGIIVQNEWLKTKIIRPELNLYLEDFVIMPDHFHGIIIIRRRCARPDASTVSFSPEPGTKKGPQCNNIPSIVRGFKSAVTIQARKINPRFRWQRRYYDRVIRHWDEYCIIRDYIRANPNK
jgi:putative transposase